MHPSSGRGNNIECVGGMSSCGPPPGNRVGRPCRRPLMVWSHQLRSLLRRFDSGAHGPRMTGTGVVVISPPSMRRHVAASDIHQASGLPPPGALGVSPGHRICCTHMHSFVGALGVSPGHRICCMYMHSFVGALGVISRSSHMLHAYAFFRGCSRGFPGHRISYAAGALPVIGAFPVIAWCSRGLSRSSQISAEYRPVCRPGLHPYPRVSALRVHDPSTASWSFTRFEVRSVLSDGSAVRAYASVSSRAHAAVSLVMRAGISARTVVSSTAQLIVMSAMAHERALASHGARFWVLGPQPWHRETTRSLGWLPAASAGRTRHFDLRCI